MTKQSMRVWLVPKDLTSVAAGFLGLIFGLWFIGLGNILPGSINWLNRGDLAAYQLNWEFFRQTPLLQWPLTAVPNYGASFHTVLFSGNALVEIPLKILGPVLPSTFQYIGMWIVGCFILQGYFASRLLSHFVTDQFVRFSFAAVFVISPVLVFRIGIAGHPFLGPHWLILCGMYLYFCKRQNHIYWSILLALALAINIYISAMVVIIYLAAIGKSFFARRNESSETDILRLVLVPPIVAALSFIALGYLEFGSAAKGNGFFRLNGLAFLNPKFLARDSFSFLLNHFGPLRNRQFGAEEGEGFAYLGLGVIFTIPIIFAYIARHHSAISWRRIIPILIACVFLFVVALSNRIVVIRHEFSYWLPEKILDLRQIFRAATRFAWPLYYLLTLVGLVAVVRLVRRKKFLIIAAFMLVGIQIVDQFPGLAYSHRVLSSQPPYLSPLVDPEWKNLGQTYSKIRLFPNFDLQVGEGTPDAEYWNDEWFHFARFAVNNRMATEFGYFLRPITPYLEPDNIKVLGELSSGKLEPNTIYILSNPETWKAASEHLDHNSRALVLDGYYVILGPIISK